MRLARQITAQYHGSEAANNAEAEFEKIFGKTGDGLPENIEEVELSAPAEGVTLQKLLTVTELVPSGGEARRLLQQGGIKVNQIKETNGQKTYNSGDELIVQAGKRNFKKIILK
jgi:tyrosyl-tRNA synthetase